MGKKKKNKYFKDSFNQKSSKKSKKSKKSAYERPKMKSVKMSLSKKDIKENKKIILQPVDIPKAFTKNRDRCNHADTLISVKEFKEMTPNYAAYTPILDTMIEAFGEENIKICKACYDVLVDRSAIKTSIRDAVASLYAYANLLVSNKRMKDGKIKDIAQMKNELSNWFEIEEKVGELEEDGAFSSEIHESENEFTDEDMAKLSKASRSFTV